MFILMLGGLFYYKICDIKYCLIGKICLFIKMIIFKYCLQFLLFGKDNLKKKKKKNIEKFVF